MTLDQLVTRCSSSCRAHAVSLIWGAILFIWFVALCVVPDPRPLSAPEWSVGVMRSLIGLSEPSARAVATIVHRATGMGLIGILLSLTLAQVPMRYAAPLVLVGAMLLATASQWINYGYVPIAAQLQLGLASATVGALAGLARRRNRIAMAVLVILATGLFVWGTSTGIADDLDEAARATGFYVLANAVDIPSGDDGFAELIHSAFTFAEDNSHGTDAVQPNKAAILALGVILGDERVAQVAKRQIDMGHKEEFEALRSRVTLRGRHDLARHFWVSAALAVLSDEDRSMTVGIGKEMMDATPGGSGFSFIDLMADRAGIMFAEAATRSTESARNMQLRVRFAVSIADYFPQIQGLPEGLSRDVFQEEFGGLGGEKTEKVVDEIRDRLAACNGLKSGY
jgi:uncharacterized protein YfiM (DUF2279 family)